MGPRTAVGVTWRQLRLSTAVMTSLVVAMVALGVASYDLSGGAPAMVGTLALVRNPAFRALYGNFSTLDTAGAFVLWKLGLVVTLAVALWGALAATRVTRGAEDVGTWDLLVTGTAGRGAIVGQSMAVLAVMGVAVGTAVFATFALSGQRLADSALYGAGVVGLVWCAQAVGVAAAQVLAPRRSASQGALAVVGVAYLARMVADASTNGAWLRDATPFGWLENLGAFQRAEPIWLVALLVGPALAVTALLPLARRRDVGLAQWTRSDRAAARSGLLRTPWRFAWRELASTIAVWLIVTAVVGLVIGYLTNALVVFSRGDPSLGRLLARWHLALLASVHGFVGEIGATLAFGISFFVVSAVATVGGDVSAGRLDLPLGYGAGRRSWLAATVVATAGATVLIALVTASATWIGVGAGGSSLAFGAALGAMLNAISIAPLVLGATALAVSLAPRVAQVVLAALLAVSYLTAVLGPAMHWPRLIVEASLYHYVRLVPAEAPNWRATVVFAVLGAAAFAGGLSRFRRADLVA